MFTWKEVLDDWSLVLTTSSGQVTMAPTVPPTPPPSRWVRLELSGMAGGYIGLETKIVCTFHFLCVDVGLS